MGDARAADRATHMSQLRQKVQEQRKYVEHMQSQLSRQLREAQGVWVFVCVCARVCVC